MALFETLSAMLTGKAAAAAATLTIVSGTAAGATGTLPQGLQSAFDDVTGVEEPEPTGEFATLETDPDLADPTDEVTEEPTDESTDAPTDEVTDEPIDEVTEDDGADIDEIAEDQAENDADARSEKATQVLTELGDGCMPEADDCDFGQAVAENARQKGAEASAEGKARAEEHKARRGAATEGPDEADTTEDATPDPTTEDEAAAPEPALGADDSASTASTSDDTNEEGPGASQRPDHAGR